MKYQNFAIFLLLAFACQSQDSRDTQVPVQQAFVLSGTSATVTDSRLLEVSGIEASVKNPGLFWVHNDSGDDARIFLIDSTGRIRSTVRLEGIENIDWEDITVIEQDDGKSQIIIADIGDNRAARDHLALYKINEPYYSSRDTAMVIAAEQIEKMELTYDEGPRDSETLFFDYLTKQLVQLTKREENVLIYSYPFQSGTRKQIKAQGSIPFRNLTAGDANQQGEIVLKNYDNIFYYAPSPSNSVMERILSGPDYRLAYKVEPQGEALCWFGHQLVTLSEKNPNAKQILYFYERKAD